MSWACIPYSFYQHSEIIVLYKLHKFKIYYIYSIKPFGLRVNVTINLTQTHSKIIIYKL